MRSRLAMGWTRLAIVTAALALSLLPSRAVEARGIMIPLDVQLSSAIIMMVGSGSSCVTFSYDLNGNRTSQAVSTIGSGGVLWGAGAFGCFIWAP